MKTKIRINSIFPSINGEVSGRGQGSLCTFIRFQGCNLRCSYCDTKYSQNESGGEEWAIPHIIKVVKSYGLTNITITGGEPLLQREGLIELVEKLQDAHRQNYISVCIETNGSLPIPEIWGVVWVVDWKTPSSGMGDKMDLSNFQNLSPEDFVKFVIANQKDFDKAVNTIKEINNLSEVLPPRYAFSPVQGKRGTVQSNKLVEWMTGTKVCRENHSILNLQLHKLIDVL